MASLKRVELGVSGIQDNWATFPNTIWNNPTGVPVSIKIATIAFAGADTLIGELASWAMVPDASGITFPGITPKVSVVFSYGAEVYVPPSQSLQDTVYFGSDEITIPSTGCLYFATNAGPVNLPGGGASRAFTYVSAVRFWYHT